MRDWEERSDPMTEIMPERKERGEKKEVRRQRREHVKNRERVTLTITLAVPSSVEKYCSSD